MSSRNLAGLIGGLFCDCDVDVVVASITFNNLNLFDSSSSTTGPASK
jgi:hypothetical protein